MWLALGVGSALCFLFGLTIWLARKEGSKEAQLQAALAQQKKDREEQERAKRITNSVLVMDEYTVRQRLHEIANNLKR